ncbi:hypothetical protein [Tunturiibacter gelidiferens]|uniref:hypothetical protein n=1 Tax=Tunturiibacter gelidiferens TaxID=3069689 RepID=UPI003D9B48F3
MDTRTLRGATTLQFPLHTLTSQLGLLVGPKGFGHYWKTHYADKTFEHLYRWNAFDTAMLIPYFIVMIILAFYGIHRYQLVWLYFKNKKMQRSGVSRPCGLLKASCRL